MSKEELKSVAREPVFPAGTITERLIAEKQGAIGWITFNNPARRNAVSMAMWEALGDIVGNYAADDAIRVIVLKGAGDKAFVSGADISEFEEKRSSPETTKAYHEVSAKPTWLCGTSANRRSR